jgi:hypothetical protein
MEKKSLDIPANSPTVMQLTINTTDDLHDPYFLRLEQPIPALTRGCAIYILLLAGVVSLSLSQLHRWKKKKKKTD